MYHIRNPEQKPPLDQVHKNGDIGQGVSGQESSGDQCQGGNLKRVQYPPKRGSSPIRVGKAAYILMIQNHQESYCCISCTIYIWEMGRIQKIIGGGKQSQVKKVNMINLDNDPVSSNNIISKIILLLALLPLKELGSQGHGHLSSAICPRVIHAQHRSTVTTFEKKALVDA
ncbi:hypothetical protein H6P81_015524 [Aristolochia fimbriata]|uniref:Uncharacterized protein n=1 Tax=Aristolochia fimbriata TaxID=158543 RepID=A0AAV7E600_ARIFI|nr:hypothetical protein H6P81_015524 [Aristolochia fimbriata]